MSGFRESDVEFGCYYLPAAAVLFPLFPRHPLPFLYSIANMTVISMLRKTRRDILARIWCRSDRSDHVWSDRISQLPEPGQTSPGLMPSDSI